MAFSKNAKKLVAEGYSREEACRICEILKPVAKELINENNPHPRVVANSEPPDTDPNSPPTKPGGH